MRELTEVTGNFVHLLKTSTIRWVVVGVFVVVVLTFSTSQPTRASETFYYINNQAGVSCNNAGPGTSTTTPWCDFTPVNSKTFGPGDQILLARGAVWTQRMDLSGSGTANNYIRVDAYGSGAKPVIQGNGNASDRTIVMANNPSYWSLNNLEVRNAGGGIILQYTTLGNQGLRFNNLYIHDVDKVFRGSPAQSDFPIYDSTSLLIAYGTSPYPSASQWVVRDIQITNLETYKTNAPTFAAGVGATGVSPQGYPPNSIQDVVIKDGYFHQQPSGWAFQNMSNVVVMDSRIETAGLIYLPQGTTATFLWSAQNITFVNNIFKGVADTASTDQSGVDNEAYDDQIHYRGNYISGNAGPGLEWLSGRSGDFNTNHEVSSNAFSANATANSSTYKGSLFFLRGSDTTLPFTGSARDNLYYEPSGFTSGDFSQWTLTNNKSVSSAANLFNAGDQFSAVQNQNQWRYQFYNGSFWTDINPYDGTNQRWGIGGYVARFNQLPDSNSATWLARTWTAQISGTISIRGRVLKNDIGGGDGVRVRIKKNGSVIWPTNGIAQSIAYNDQSGYDTNLDWISVSPNDLIRFEINSGGANNGDNDVTSWSPSIGYVNSLRGIYNDDSGDIFYSGSWYGLGNRGAGDYGDDVHATQTNGNYVQFSFTGSSIGLLTETASDQGNIDISIDNGPATRINTYSSVRQARRLVFLKTDLTSTTHTIRVTKVDGTWALIDGFTTLNPDNDNSSAVSYNGVWYGLGNRGAGDYGDDVHATQTNGNYTLYTFTGTAVSLLTETASDQGNIDVAICDVNGGNCGVTTRVNTYSATRQSQQIVYQSSVLSAGVHTLKVTKVDATWMVIDAFLATP